MYSSMLFCIGYASTLSNDDRITYIKNGMTLTPLERLAKVYKDSGDDCFYKVIGPYDVFLHAISNEKTRKELNNIDYKARYNSPVFRD